CEANVRCAHARRNDPEQGGQCERSAPADGEIGRHARLRTWCTSVHGGSNPSQRTERGTIAGHALPGRLWAASAQVGMVQFGQGAWFGTRKSQVRILLPARERMVLTAH